MEVSISCVEEIGMKISTLGPERIFLWEEKESDPDLFSGVTWNLWWEMENIGMCYDVDKLNIWQLESLEFIVF